MKLFTMRRRWKERKTRARDEQFETILRDGLEALRARQQSMDSETERAWARVSRTLDEIGNAAPSLRPRRFTHSLGPALAIAGGAAVLLVVLLLLPSKSQEIVYETQRGEQSAVTLPDSSEVLLNHTTTLRVEPVAASGMRVVKLRGEALFRIRRGEGPFVVRTEIGVVTVLGTEFNVSVRGNRLEVAVMNGVVRVDGQEESGNKAVTLEAGQLTTCQGEGGPEPPSPLPFADYPGWVFRKLLFTRASLEVACREIEDRFDARVRIENDSLRSSTITGAIDAPSAEQAVFTIARLTGAKLRNENGRFILY